MEGRLQTILVTGSANAAGLLFMYFISGGPFIAWLLVWALFTVLGYIRCEYE